MSETLLALILQYGLKYGLPAAIAIGEAVFKPGVTWDEIKAAFKLAETAYGLTPEILPPKPPQ